MSIPLEIKLTLKLCPICDTWMEGESSQERSPWWINCGKTITNKNTIKCPTCSYTEINIQRYSEFAIKALNCEKKSLAR